MKAYRIGAQTGLAALELGERPDPVAGPGEALLRVRAVCLNHRDLKIVGGEYGPRRAEDRVPVSDGIGEVVAIGDGVKSVAVGDRAICGHFVTWLDGAFSQSAFGSDLGVTRDGWLAELIAVPAAALVKVPDSVSDARAAALPAAGLTAWHAVVEVGKVRVGDTVLVLGTGGVSILALQIAKAAGARVAVTSSSDAKLAQARALGADMTVNYTTTPDWAAAVLAATGGAGADIVVETGGQATLAQSIAAAAVNARIVIIGALAGQASEGLANFSTIIGKNLTLRGIAAGSRAMLAALVRAVDANGIEPVIARSFAFADAPAAYAYLKAGDAVGKVLITAP